jgi:biotin-dependent carboxylase-like uncharacterized protein
MLEVVEPGLLTTVQDAGRGEALDLGVPLGGACDPWSLAVANAAVGNPVGAAALEMTLLGGVFRATGPCVVATAGADMGDGPGAAATPLHEGDMLRFGPAEPGTGIRNYLALAGGVDVPVVLGSRSTCLVGNFGGLEGRALRTGDHIRAASPSGPPTSGLARPNPPSTDRSMVRLVAGPHRDAVSRLIGQTWQVGGRADRQGIRLEGAPVAAPEAGTILSRPVTWGTVQLPADGWPIVLLADAQTVGGYPVLGTVVTADRHILGQLGPGDELRFRLVSVAEAQAALRDGQW